MNMHVTFYHEINSQLNNSNVHAWNELQFDMLGLEHDSIHQFRHEPSKNQYKHNNEGLNILT